LNVATLVLIFVVVIAARHQLVDAWHLLGKTNLLVLLLLIPVQFASYYASTEIFFTYLRARGQLAKTSTMQATGMSLELNFVNHVFPSGGVSGVSYMVWRLSKLGVSAGQATMAQIMKYVVQMSTFMVLMAVALIWATVENRTANWVVVAVAVGITALIFVVIFGGYLIGSAERMRSFARFLTRGINKLVAKITFGRKTEALKLANVEKFFADFHEDFTVLKADKKMLIKPILWSFAFNLLDVSLFLIAFASLGVFINPAILLIAYGAATLSGMFMLTPGGAGAYEAIMIGILTASGVAAGTAFAGVVLARAILIIGTLTSGFIVYQHALRRYGQPDLDRKIDLTPDAEIKRAKTHGQ
jgi:uncharacterized protein (TIRG00374 family)